MKRFCGGLLVHKSLSPALDGPMRILCLTDADVFAGTEKLIYDLATSFAPEDASVTIGCPSPSPLETMAKEASVETLQVGANGCAKGLSADMQTVRRLKSVWARRQFDVVHVHNGRSALIAALSGAGRKVPMVMSQHFLDPARTGRRGAKAIVSRWLHQWLETRIARHIAISKAVKEACVRNQIAHADKIDVVLNGVRLPATSHNEATWRQETWAASLEPDSFVFCAARAEPEKDLPTLILAMAKLRQARPAVECAIAGGGSQLEQSRELVKALSPSPKVTLLGFRDDVAQLMAACTVFVLPAIAEPFGLVLAEAMALGKPVIACDAGGPREIVVHEETGLLVPASDAQAMAGAIGRLLSDAPLRTRMGQAALQRYQTFFTSEAMSQSMLDVYQRVACLNGQSR